MYNIIDLVENDQLKANEKKELIDTCFLKVVVTVDVSVRTANRIKENVCNEINVKNLWNRFYQDKDKEWT